MGVTKWGALFLLIGGVVHLIPSLYEWLSDLTSGTPWIQIIVGVISVILALAMLAKKE